MSVQIATLIPALVGGLLAIVGGFFATYFAQTMTRNAERRKVIREKVEEIYNLSNAVRDWVLTQVSFAKEFRIHGKAKVPHKELEYPSGKLEMLAMLYFPPLQSSIKEYLSLAEALDVTYDAVVGDVAVPMDGGSSIMHTDFFKKSLSEDDLNSLLKDFEAFERLHVNIHASLKKFIQY